MPLSLVTVIGSWVGPDNAPATGTVVFQAVQEAPGGGYMVAGVPIAVPLVAGAISKQLVNNAQVTALQYQVTEHIDNAPVVSYVITPTGATLDLSTAPRGTGTSIPIYVQTSSVGVANGVASLDGTGHVPSSQLPSGTGVLDVTAGDSTITIGGTGPHPTVAVNAIPESKVTNLVSDLSSINTSLGTKATKPIMRRAWITSGDTTPPSTGSSWAIIPGFEIDIPAVVGDTVEISVSAMRSQNTSTFLDVAVVTGSAPIVLERFMATGTGTPAVEGEPDWYTQNTFIGHAGPHSFVVGSGDLDGSNVRFALVCKSNGTGTVYSSSNYPFYWQAANWGAVG